MPPPFVVPARPPASFPAPSPPAPSAPSAAAVPFITSINVPLYQRNAPVTGSLFLSHLFFEDARAFARRNRNALATASCAASLPAVVVGRFLEEDGADLGLPQVTHA